MKMRFVFVIATLFTINFVHLLVLRKWGMSEKVERFFTPGFEKSLLESEKNA